MRHFHPSNLFMSVYKPIHQCRLLKEYLVTRSLGFIQSHILPNRMRKYFEVRLAVYIFYHKSDIENNKNHYETLAYHFIFKDSCESDYALYIVFEDIKTNISCVHETRKRFLYRISKNIAPPMQ